MANQRVGTLVLEGQDSISFVNSLIRPTQEEICHFRSVFERIDNQIEIKDSATGFTASIPDLDLSFLHDSSEEKIINFNVTFILNSEEENYLSDATELEKAVVDVVVDGSYNEHYDSSYFIIGVIGESMESGFQFKNPSLTKLEFSVNRDFVSYGKECVQIQVNMSVDITRDQNSNEATVALRVEIGDKSAAGPYYVNVIEEARFRWAEEFSGEQVDKLLNQNAPSLLLSYVRPIVAQTTAASQYGSYNIPFMNFTKGSKQTK